MTLAIAHALTRYRPALGGVELYLEAFVQRSVAAGFDVRVHTTDLATWGEGTASARLPEETPRRELGPPRVYRHRATPLARGRYAFSPAMARALGHDDADIFHAHAYGHFAADAAAVAARLRRRPLVLNPYVAFAALASPLARAHAAGLGRLLRAADRVITLSAAEEERLVRLGFDRTRFARVSPGVDLQEFAAPLPRPGFLPDRGPVLLFVGRLAADKGIGTLLAALPRIRHAVPEATLVLVGPDFGCGAEVRAAMGRPDLAGGIVAAGCLARRDLVAAYQHADLFLFPSRAEAFGIVLAEAMACGLVTVAARSTAIPEVIGDAGVLFEPGDAAALARAVLELLGDPGRRRTLAEAGRCRVRERFDWERSAAVLHQVYDDVHAGRGRRTIVAFGFAARPRTGGERYYRELLQAAASHGLAVCEVQQESMPAWARRRHLAALWALPRLAARQGALLFLDLAWNPRLTPLLPIARFLFRQRVVIGVCHRPSSGERRRWWRRFLAASETCFLRLAHRVLTISEASAREVEAAGVEPRRVLVLRPALAPRARPAAATPGPAVPDGTASFRIVTVGGITPRKRLGDLVAACGQLAFPWRLDVIGDLEVDAAETARLRQLVAAHGLTARVHLHGRATDAERDALLAAADAYVHPSGWEGFGYAVAEAMQFGLPVVACDVGAMPELVDHETTGYLVPLGDPARLAEAVAMLAADPARARRMGEAGARAASRLPRPAALGDAFARALEAWSSDRSAAGGPQAPRTVLALGWEPWQSPPQCSLAEILAVVARRDRVVWVNPQPEWNELGASAYWNRSWRGHAARRTPEGVLVVDPPPLPPFAFRFLPRPLREGWILACTEVAKRIWAVALRRALRRAGSAPDVVLVTEPFDLALAGRLGEVCAAYYVFDESSAMPGPPALRHAIARAEARGIGRVDVVFASSLAQAERRRGLHPRVVPLPNGVDPARYATVAGCVPADLAAIPRPRLLVVGQVDFRLDAELLAAVAARRPAWSLVLLGPVRSSGRAAVDRLAGLSNVHFLGHRDPAELAAYQEASDVGLVPFVVTPATLAMRPLRLLAYLASGLPVVSVPLPEVECFAAHVHVAAGAEAWIAAIEAALAEDGTEARAERRAAVEAESWERRAGSLWSALGDVVRGATGGAGALGTMVTEDDGGARGAPKTGGIRALPPRGAGGDPLRAA
jgi:glycosyltransferase involved in cell wall biosynthesis